MLEDNRSIVTAIRQRWRDYASHRSSLVAEHKRCRRRHCINGFLNNQRQATTQTLLQGGYISAFEQVDREVFIVAEALTNSLVVSATPALL